nr:hypothetical protein [Pyxidicoccus caerfyrddinensis]
MDALRDDGPQVRVVKDAQQPVVGKEWIERDIGRSGHPDAQHGGDDFRAGDHHQAHAVSRFDAERLAKTRGYARGALKQFRAVKHRAREDDLGRLRQAQEGY